MRDCEAQHVQPVMLLRAGDGDIDIDCAIKLIGRIVEKRVSDLIDLRRGQEHKHAESPLTIAADCAAWAEELEIHLSIGALLDASHQVARQTPQSPRTQKRLAREGLTKAV